MTAPTTGRSATTAAATTGSVARTASVFRSATTTSATATARTTVRRKATANSNSNSTKRLLHHRKEALADRCSLRLIRAAIGVEASSLRYVQTLISGGAEDSLERGWDDDIVDAEGDDGT
eukprot:CAMPEP_0178525990 /NCGR_PEP_ID=MMETSP0696-20121128/30486_1 /TAXON_ID=265572 /ORGANISM="Extubocellulus spinifer, Strain CCMP396" /LENGTH=119 /DNA_ID=CAMNT_0020157459 /DNA_START=237 /DNA_END=596 /DNA_ORIENTATION=-